MVKMLRIFLLALALGLAGTMSIMFCLSYFSRELPPQISTTSVVPENSINKVHLVQREVGELRWMLDSQRANIFDGESRIDLEGIDLLIITEDKGRLKIIGDQGIYSQEKKELWVSGNVKVISSANYVLYSDDLYWDIEKETIRTRGPARAEGPTSSISGSVMTIHVPNQKIYIRENVNAQLN